jgi:trypsin
MLACALALGAVAVAGAAPAAAAPKAKPSVAGGSPASIAEYGYTVAVLNKGRFFCSGAVIAPTRVVTAAHCITGPASQITVVAGRTAVSGPGGEALAVSGVSVHPGAGNFRNDLAVLALATPTSSPPIPLASPEEDAMTTGIGAPLFVSGFGRRNPFGFGKPKTGLLFAAQLFSRPGCKKYKGSFFVAQMICANGRQYKRAKRFRVKLMRSACPGDSGGPLVAATPNGLRLVGVVSFGAGSPFILCAEKGLPGVFTRVSAFLDFLGPHT